jgi:hypothetical protein
MPARSIDLARLANGFANRRLRRAGEDIPDTEGMLAENVRVDAQRYGRISVAEPGGDNMDRHPGQQQRRGMQVTQVMQTGMRQRLSRRHRFVVRGNQLVHERGHGVRVERLAPFGGEDQAVTVAPGGASSLAFVGLTEMVLAEDRHGFLVNADDARPAALGGSLDTPTADNGGRSAEGDLGGVEVNRGPPEAEEFAATGAGIGGEPVEGVQPV